MALLRRLDVPLPDYLDSGSWKTYCVFADLHVDHGVDKSMRVYPDTNTAYCFGGCGSFTPTTLAAQAWDVPRVEAARRLLDEIGWAAPVTDWSNVPEPPVDRGALAEALRVWCDAFDPTWREVQYRQPVAGQLERCLALLPLVHNGKDASEWLTACKQVMMKCLETRAMR